MSILFESLNNLPESEPIVYKDKLFTSIEVRKSILKNKIDNIDNLTENDFKDIILKENSLLLDYDNFLSTAENKYYVELLFTNNKFLLTFLSVINLLELNNNQIICFNKIVLAVNKDDNNIKNLLLLIGSQLNNKKVILLSAYLGIEQAKELAIIANSSFNLERRVNKVHQYIVKNTNNLSIQTIVDILLVFFTCSFSQVFTAFMNIKDESNDENHHKNYINLTAAIIEILNSMQESDIYKVLRDYLFLHKTNPSRNLDNIMYNYQHYKLLYNCYLRAKENINYL